MNAARLDKMRKAWRIAAPFLAALLLGIVGWLAWRALPPGDTLDAVRSWTALGAAALAYMAVLALLPIIWAGLLKGLRAPSERPPLTDLYPTYSRSWLARYIPGRIWTYGGRAALAAQVGVPMGTSARSMVLEILFSYGMLTVLGAGLLISAELGTLPGMATLAVGTAAIAGAFLALGRARGIVRYLPARLQSVAGTTSDKRPALAWPIAAYAGHGTLNLAFFVLTALAFVPLSGPEILHVAGAWGLAMTLGWLAVLAPGGLGARDGVALLFLAPMMDPGTAALIVAAARLVSIVLDFVFVGLVEVALFALRLRRSGARPNDLEPETQP